MCEGAEKAEADVYAVDYFCGVEPEWSEIDASAPVAILDGESALEDMLYQQRLSSSVCDKLMRRSLLAANPFKEGTYYEDMQVLARILPLCGRVAYCKLPLYFYRQHSASFVHIFTEKRLHVLDVTAEIEARCIGNVRLLPAARDRRFAASFNMFVLASAAGHPRAADCWLAVKKLRKEVLGNPESRVKNKLGAIVSYLGRPITLLVAKIVYR